MNSAQFKKHRKDLNLTQRQLAIKLGLSENNGGNHIRRIENNKRNPSGSLLKALELLTK
tara:strand:+ start:31 stop:207 length:177 start_codon:yes stop_codon:yes gene_type:complete